MSQQLADRIQAFRVEGERINRLALMLEANNDVISPNSIARMKTIVANFKKDDLPRLISLVNDMNSILGT